MFLSASQMKLQGDRSTPGRQSVSAVDMTPQRRSSISSQVSERTRTGWNYFDHEGQIRDNSALYPDFCLVSALFPSAVNELPKYRTKYSFILGFTTAASAASTATTSSDQQPSKIFTSFL